MDLHTAVFRVVLIDNVHFKGTEGQLEDLQTPFEVIVVHSAVLIGVEIDQLVSEVHQGEFKVVERELILQLGKDVFDVVHFFEDIFVEFFQRV